MLTIDVLLNVLIDFNWMQIYDFYCITFLWCNVGNKNYDDWKEKDFNLSYEGFDSSEWQKDSCGFGILKQAQCVQGF